MSPDCITLGVKSYCFLFPPLQIGNIQLPVINQEYTLVPYRSDRFYTENSLQEGLLDLDPSGIYVKIFNNLLNRK